MEQADRQDKADFSEAKRQRVQEKIALLKSQMEKLDNIEAKLKESPDKQISLTDPDARAIATRGRGKGVVGYNVQTAVDIQHHLIVAHEVTNVGHDRTHLFSMASLAKQTIGAEEMTLLADRDYFSGEQILACDQADIITYLPKPQTTVNKAKGFFTKRDFIYHPEADEYQCPSGKRLIYRFTREEKGQVLRCYWSSVCPRCAMKSQCTTGDDWRISRWEHEAVVDAAERRLDLNPDSIRIRRSTVEHRFGTLKTWMGL